MSNFFLGKAYHDRESNERRQSLNKPCDEGQTIQK